MRRWKRWGLIALFLAVAVLPPVAADRFTLRLIILTLLMTQVFVGLNIVTGFCGQVSLCQAAFYGMGAYASAGLALHYHVPVLVAAPLASTLSGVLGWALSRCTVRMKSHYLALATIGFGEIITNVFRGGGNWTGGDNGLSGIPTPSIWFFGTLDTPQRYYFLVLLVSGVIWFLFWALSGSRLGLALKAVRENEPAASSLGFDTSQLKVIAFTMSAVFAGLAGALYAHFDGFIGPESFSTALSIEWLCALVVGGLGSFSAPFLAAGLITPVQEYFRGFVNYHVLLFGVTVILLMIVAPQGAPSLVRKVKVLIARLIWARRNSTKGGGLHNTDIHWSPDYDVAVGSNSNDCPAGNNNAATVQLCVANVTVQYDGVTALDNVSFKVCGGELICLIGPNGAGKTTLLDVLTGHVRPLSGQAVMTTGRGPLKLVGAADYRIARNGLGRTFQISQVFSSLTVWENVEAGQVAIDHTAGPLDAALFPFFYKSRRAGAKHRAAEWLRFTGLWEYRNELAGQLPYSLRRVLEIARALAGNPAILLVDEPSAGMTLEERRLLAVLLQKIIRMGITLIVVAHDLALVHEIASRVIVLDHGRVIFDEHPDQLRENVQVVEAYLGARRPNARY